MARLASSTLFQAQAAHFRFSPDYGHIAESHRSATKSAEARRLAVNFAKLLGLLRRSPPRSQPQIHDSPRNQLNSRSIGDGEARSSRQRE